MRTGARLGAGLAVFLLAGCAAPPMEEGRREATVPAVPAMAPKPPSTPRPTPKAVWAFQKSESECTARAAGDGAVVLVTVSRTASIRLNVSLPSLPPRSPASVPLRFTGGAGSWQLTGRPEGSRQVVSDLGTDDMALSRVLALLGGGTLEAMNQAVSIVPAGPQGQQWFDCARQQIF